MDDEFTIELHNNIQAYKDFVFEDFWKSRNFSKAGGMYSPDSRCDYFDAENLLSSKIFADTTLAYNGTGQFLHYTTIFNLISILRTQSIRLYDFNNFNDSTEFIYAHKLFKQYHEPKDLRELRRQLFGLSMCEYSDDLVQNNINLWRLYGADGFGACVTFELSDGNRDKMVDYALGKIQYCDTTTRIESLEKIVQRDREFTAKHNFRCNNLSDVVTPLCCFYKSKLFDIENEVRLFHFSKKRPFCRHESESVKCELNRHGKKVHFIELPVGVQTDPFVPFLKIKTIHFGYKMTQEEIDEFIQVFIELDFPYNINFDVSPVKRHFN